MLSGVAGTELVLKAETHQLPSCQIQAHDNLSAPPYINRAPPPHKSRASPESRSPKSTFVVEISIGSTVTTSLPPSSMRRCTSDPSGQHRCRRRRSSDEGTNELAPWPGPVPSMTTTAHGIADTAAENHQRTTTAAATGDAAITAVTPLVAPLLVRQLTAPVCGGTENSGSLSVDLRSTEASVERTADHGSGEVAAAAAGDGTADIEVTSVARPATSADIPCEISSEEEENSVVGRNDALPTKKGTCIVCLTDNMDVLDATWLHERGGGDAGAVEKRAVDKRAGEGTEGDGEVGDRCPVSACLECLKRYFEGIVESGFNGSCPRMRCMSCPRVVCEQAWGPLVDASVLETFHERATTLLSLQCGDCDFRGSMMVIPPPDHSYIAATEALTKSIVHPSSDGKSPSAERSEEPSAESSEAPSAEAPQELERQSEAENGEEEKEEAVSAPPPNVRSAACSRMAERERMGEEFRAALRRYSTGDDIDVGKFYDEVERCLSLGDAKDPQARMADVLLCVEDYERRASLHLRFLKFHPMVRSRCCQELHCFRCKEVGDHEGKSCEQFQAGRGFQGVLACPSCDVHVVRGGGCTTITCICGHRFFWPKDEAVQAVGAFRAAHPDNPTRAAAEILRRGRPVAVSRHTNAELRRLNVHPEDEEGWAEHPDQTDNAADSIESLPPPTAAPAVVEEPTFEDQETSDEVDGPGPERIEETITGEEQEPVLDDVQPVVALEPVPEPGLDGGHVSQVPEPFDDVQGTGPDVLHEPFFGYDDEDAATEGVRVESEAEREYGLAETFADVFVHEVEAAHASIFAEEHPHLTAERAVFAVERPDLERERVRRRIMGPLPQVTAEALEQVNAEQQWISTATRAWLDLNEGPAEAVQRRNAAARAHLVEALYGSADNDNNSNAIMFVAAERAREALSDASADGRDGPLFRNVDVPQPPASNSTSPPLQRPQHDLPGIWPPAEDECTRGDRSQGRLASSTAVFGCLDMRERVEAWLSGTPARQDQLRSATLEEEERLADAWTALWGRPLRGACGVSGASLTSDVQIAKAEVDPGNVGREDGVDGDVEAAIMTAARRVAFLEAYPEHACAEQAPMMKAFSRRNWGAVERAREEATTERALEFQRMHGGGAGDQDLDGIEGGDVSDETFERVLDAYYKQVVWEKDRPLEVALGGWGDPSSFEERRRRRMAEVWGRQSRKRIVAREFGRKFGKNAATTAVLLLKAASHSLRVCTCGLKSAAEDAAAWVLYNSQEYEVALAEMKRRTEAESSQENRDRASEGQCDPPNEHSWCLAATYEAYGLDLSTPGCTCVDAVSIEETDDRVLLFGGAV